jgi:hypothetical protein
MPDLKLDPLVGDLFVAADGRAALTDDASGETTAQHVRIRLRMFKGEWFLNKALGIDYIGQVFVKNPNMAAIASIFKNTILGTPGVSSIVTYNQTFNPATRSLLVVTTILTTSGATKTIEESIGP